MMRIFQKKMELDHQDPHHQVIQASLDASHITPAYPDPALRCRPAELISVKEYEMMEWTELDLCNLGLL